jgi:hypothetical protein
MQAEEYKRCKTCGEMRPLAEFHRQRSGALGRRSICRGCRCPGERGRPITPREIVIDDAFGHWLAGFIDGEGSFTITAGRGRGSAVCALSLGLRDDDRPILDDIACTTGLGRVFNHHRSGTSRPRAVWKVYSRPDCAALVNLLDRYPLRAKKARDYAIWREAVGVWTAVIYRGPGAPALNRPTWDRMAVLREEIRKVRIYTEHGAASISAAGK